MFHTFDTRIYFWGETWYFVKVPTKQVWDMAFHSNFESICVELAYNPHYWNRSIYVLLLYTNIVHSLYTNPVLPCMLTWRHDIAEPLIIAPFPNGACRVIRCQNWIFYHMSPKKTQDLASRFLRQLARYMWQDAWGMPTCSVSDYKQTCRLEIIHHSKFTKNNAKAPGSPTQNLLTTD